MPTDIGNRPLRIAIGAGHRNSSGGNQFETSMTALATKAVVDLCRASDGFEIRSYTPNDGLGWFNGPLDAAAAQVRQWAAAGWVADILHELHFEGLGNTSVRGAFVIYPDSAGLVGRNAGNIDIDVQAAAGKMAQIIAESYGGVTRYGIPGRGMSERETGVGIDGWRLGVFGAWAEPVFIENSFQFITEAATYTNPEDLALMKAPDFPQKHAAGILGAYMHIAKTRGNWTYAATIGAGAPPTMEGTPDGLAWPNGIDEGIVSRAFGRYQGEGIRGGNVVKNFNYGFNVNGVISKTWYKRAKASDAYPAVVNAAVFDDRWYVFFANGWILYKAGSAGWKWVS